MAPTTSPLPGDDDRPVALVTGCGKPDGMGFAIARTLARGGYAVMVSDRDASGVANTRGVAADLDGWRGVDSVVDAIRDAGGVAVAQLADVSDEQDAARLIAFADDTFGRLDVLVNNAAAPQGDDRVDIARVSIAEWRRQLSVNLDGPFFLSRAAVPVMRRRRRGRIVNIASMAGLTGAPHSVAYSASKAGVIGLTRSLAMDVGPWGITVNAVCPGLIDTSRATLNMTPADDRDEFLHARAVRIPVGRVGAAQDVADLVAYLASDAAGYITGQALPLDGGGLSPFRLTLPDD